MIVLSYTYVWKFWSFYISLLKLKFTLSWKCYQEIQKNLQKISLFVHDLAFLDLGRGFSLFLTSSSSLFQALCWNYSLSCARGFASLLRPLHGLDLASLPRALLSRVSLHPSPDPGLSNYHGLVLLLNLVSSQKTLSKNIYTTSIFWKSATWMF